MSLQTWDGTKYTEVKDYKCIPLYATYPDSITKFGPKLALFCQVPVHQIYLFEGGIHASAYLWLNTCINFSCMKKTPIYTPKSKGFLCLMTCTYKVLYSRIYQVPRNRISCSSNKSKQYQEFVGLMAPASSGHNAHGKIEWKRVLPSENKGMKHK